MSHKVIPFMNGNATSSTTEAKNSSENFLLQPWDLLDPGTVFIPKVNVDLAGGDYYTKRFLASEKGHKYVKQSNPTPESVKPLLAKMKEPCVLLLQGCELLLQSGIFGLDKFKSITALEISGCPHLTTLPIDTISQMTQLQSLNLSYLQIDHIPGNLFINTANSLRSLVLRGCSNLHVLPKLPQPLCELEYLDLSHLPIETLPIGFISTRLDSLILRGCSKLRFLKDELLNVRYVDLCFCTSLTVNPTSITQCSVEVLDLSNTDFIWEHVPPSVTHLFFRNARLCVPDRYYGSKCSFKVCDLSGCQDLEDISMLSRCYGLEALDLSRTGIESISFISDLTSMRTLVLKDCVRLKQLPNIELLKNLEVLDLSGCEILCDLPLSLRKQRRMKELNLCGCKGLTRLREGLFDHMSSLEKLDLSNTDIMNLPSFANLINRGIVINHSNALAKEEKLMNLGNGNTDSQAEIHLVSTFISNSGFDRFKYEYTCLNRFISFLEEKFTVSIVDIKPAMKRQFESIRVDLEYLLGKIDLLECSQNCRRSEELLHDLLNYENDNLDDHFLILEKLLRTVVKLKILVPPLPPKPLSQEERRKMLKPQLPTGTHDKMERYFLAPDTTLASYYESLRPIERNCLLYLVCIPVATSHNKPIKESTLIHLWYGEGFFDTLLNANSTFNPVPGLRSGNPHRNDPSQQAPFDEYTTREILLIQFTYGEGFSDPRLYANSTSNDRNNANQQVLISNPYRTIRKVGRAILEVLRSFGFLKLDRKRTVYMEEVAYTFVVTKATEEHFFDFDKRGNLTPQFNVSRRACLIKSKINHKPSSHIWLNNSKSSKRLESFKVVRTLLYIDEHVVDINTKWFSSMTNLHVLHLVDFISEQINIVDLKFLEELKNMQQLRLLNLESFSAINKLPDSICQLTNLRILSLKYCSNLMELPAGIAFLTNLIILDLTQCHLLPELPKGLALLSKLEVLKGFPITYDADGKQSKKACTLRELLNLTSLSKLNLVVNRDIFPNSRDLQVLKNMKQLQNLKITWNKEYKMVDTAKEGALRSSRWKQLKCWSQHNQTEEVEDELLLTNNYLGNLSKLVFCCFPLETTPNWLNPTELHKLEKLYFVGGRLKKLFQDSTGQTTWNVKALKLKHLKQLHDTWSELKVYFPSCPFLVQE